MFPRRVRVIDVSRQAMLAWRVVARTSAIDRLIAEVLQSGARVLSPAAGRKDSRQRRFAFK